MGRYGCIMPLFNMEPSQEDLAWYIEQSGYVGFHKPMIEHAKEEPLSYEFEHEAKCAEGDYLPMDDQGFE